MLSPITAPGPYTPKMPPCFSLVLQDTTPKRVTRPTMRTVVNRFMGIGLWTDMETGVVGWCIGVRTRTDVDAWRRILGCHSRSIQRLSHGFLRTAGCHSYDGTCYGQQAECEFLVCLHIFVVFSRL